MKGARAVWVRASIGLYWVSVNRFLMLGTMRLQFEATKAPIEGAAEGPHIDLKVLASQSRYLRATLSGLSGLIVICTIFHRPLDRRRTDSTLGPSFISTPATLTIA